MIVEIRAGKSGGRPVAAKSNTVGGRRVMITGLIGIHTPAGRNRRPRAVSRLRARGRGNQNMAADVCRERGYG